MSVVGTAGRSTSATLGEVSNIQSGVAVAADNLWKLDRLSAVLERAHRIGVRVIVLKGAAFLKWLYRLEERPMTDVDLLIRAEDRERFLVCLAPDIVLSAPPPILDLLPHDLSGEFGATFRGLVLDVHTSLLNRPWLRRAVALDEEGIWRRAVPTEIAGMPAWRLSNEDQLLHVVAHSVLHHATWGGRGREDLRRLATRVSVDWELVSRLSASQRVRTALWLMLVHADLADHLPTDLVQSLRPGAVGRGRVAIALRLVRAGDTAFAPMFLTDQSIDLVRAAVIALSPPREWLRQRYPGLPGPSLRRIWHAGRVFRYLLAKALSLTRHEDTGPNRASHPGRGD